MLKIKPFSDWSIRHKLTGLFMAMAGIAALTVFLLIGAFDFLALKRSMARELSTVADLLARNSSAALTFHDAEAASDVLQALQAESSVTAACIYTADGKPFAIFVRTGKASDFVPPLAQSREASFETGRLILFRKIDFAGEALGTIYIESNLDPLRKRFREYGIAFIITLFVALSLAFFIGIHLQRPISRPLIQLVQTADAISSDGDYYIRAALPNRDEFGLLVSAFNGMLQQIQNRNEQLKKHREHLEEEVASRTAELSSAHARLKLQAQALNAAANTIVITDLNGDIVWSNPAFSASSGYSAAEVLGRNPRILQSGNHEKEFFSSLWRTITSGETWRGEIVNRRKDGTLFTEETTITPVSSQAGVITHFVAIKQDITNRKIAEERVQFLAYYDALTELPNRTLLRDRLTTALAGARRRREKVAVLFLDLDRFKIINDSLGHSFGDTLLQEVAGRLKGWAREQDTVARVGGDEFVLVLSGLVQDADAAVAAQRVVDTMSAEFSVRGHSLNATCSVGVSIFPQHGMDGEALIKNADAAMYCAKQTGPNQVQFFTEDLNVQMVERLTLENGLRLALDRKEFFLVYQPQMDIATGRVVGFEALLRWQQPVLGLVPPDRFIRIAENSGLIVPIGEWVLRTACTQARKWQDEGFPAVRIAVNVSAVQFRQDGFRDLIRDVLHETGMAPQHLELELTESLLLSNADVVFSVLQDLNDMGLSLAIDDFGTGYSSLSYLKQFKVGKLKIDRSFIRDIASDSDDAAITTAIISMAKSLHLKVIAEGVENEAQMAFLREHSCDEIQGYLFSKPLSAEEIVKRFLCVPIEG
jgi:diguanylate cyclase (GGDEF)-like protein/PAS domain S-box-containing protein